MPLAPTPPSTAARHERHEVVAADVRVGVAQREQPGQRRTSAQAGDSSAGRRTTPATTPTSASTAQRCRVARGSRSYDRPDRLGERRQWPGTCRRNCSREDDVAEALPGLRVARSRAAGPWPSGWAGTRRRRRWSATSAATQAQRSSRQSAQDARLRRQARTCAMPGASEHRQAVVAERHAEHHGRGDQPAIGMRRPARSRSCHTTSSTSRTARPGTGAARGGRRGARSPTPVRPRPAAIPVAMPRPDAAGQPDDRAPRSAAAALATAMRREQVGTQRLVAEGLQHHRGQPQQHRVGRVAGGVGDARALGRWSGTRPCPRSRRRA